SVYGVFEHADIAAEADGTESLLNPVRGGGRRGWEKAGSNFVFGAHRYEAVHRLQKTRVIELGGYAHGGGQIVMTHPGDIEAGDGDDLFEILEGANGFHNDDYGGVLVGLGKVRSAGGLVEIVRQ